MAQLREYPPQPWYIGASIMAAWLFGVTTILLTVTGAIFAPFMMA